MSLKTAIDELRKAKPEDMQAEILDLQNQLKSMRLLFRAMTTGDETASLGPGKRRKKAAE